MTGSSVKPTMMVTQASNMNRTATKSPAVEASRRTSSRCSSMSGQQQNNHGDNQHQQDEEGCDCHVIGFRPSRLEFVFASHRS
jgi:hypothetical protein